MVLIAIARPVLKFQGGEDETQMVVFFNARKSEEKSEKKSEEKNEEKNDLISRVATIFNVAF